jgi:hypothetical protein
VCVRVCVCVCVIQSKGPCQNLISCLSSWVNATNLVDYNLYMFRADSKKLCRSLLKLSMVCVCVCECVCVCVCVCVFERERESLELTKRFSTGRFTISEKKKQ